jgi:hypothetical protein
MTTDPYTGRPWQPTDAAGEGAALLDRLPWPAWRELVDVAQLDMAHGVFFGRPGCIGCVGAQLDHHRARADNPVDLEPGGEYMEFLATVFPDLHETRLHGTGGSVDFAVHYGFRVPDCDSLNEETAAYAALTDAWRAVLTA